MDEGVKKRPPGRPRKHEPDVERPKRRARTSVQINNLLDHCRQRPGSDVLLEVFKTAGESRDRARQYRNRDNGPGVWSFTASYRENEYGERQYGVYGRWMEVPDGQ